jgi:hypothetical protein
MRGRGFGRGMNAGRGDMFRSRPPNTSRPPSMHVDDYVKMEMQQGQSGSASTSMPPPSLPPPVGQARHMDVRLVSCRFLLCCFFQELSDEM